MKIPFKNMPNRWRESPKYTAMQHTLLNLLCYYFWLAVTGEPNKGKHSREVTAVSFRNVQFGCFRHFWISDCVSHVWKCCSYNSFFVPVGARSPPPPPPRRKLSQMKKKKKKKEKKGKEIRMLYNKKQISVLTGQFSECMAKSIWLAFVWQGKPNLWCVCLCGFAKSRFSKSTPFRICWRGWKYPLKCQNRG